MPGVRRGVLALSLGLVALILWLGRNDIAVQFVSSYGVSVGLVTPTDHDKGRLERAFAAVQAARPDDAKLEAAEGSHFSSAYVSAPTRAQALEAARSFVQALEAAFDSEGKGQLETSVAGRAYAEADATSNAVSIALALSALVLGLLAVLLFGQAWRERVAVGDFTLPRGAGLAVAAAFLLPVAILVLPGWLFMAVFAMSIPTIIAGLIVYKMGEVRRASRWPSAQGRIVRSGMRTVNMKQDDGVPGHGNMPDVEYAFSVAGVEYHGKRIGIGEIRPNSPEVEAALERYQVGRTGPVYYNPENPEEAVLERDPPVSPRTMYAIAAGVMIVGLGIVVAFTRIGEIIEWLQPYFPPGAIIQGFLFFVACGLVVSLSLISDLAFALSAARWPTTAGTVITSRAESHRELVPRGKGQTVVVWSPLVEYSYRVGGRDYHGVRIAFGPAVSGGRGFAEAIIARYPASTPVTVHYDPANPSQATLETRVAFGWPSLLIALAFFAVALFFSGRFSN